MRNRWFLLGRGDEQQQIGSDLAATATQEFMPENTQKARNGRVNYNDLTATSLEIMVNKGNHPQMALIQVSEIL